jgi:hypothetical protein
MSYCVGFFFTLIMVLVFFSLNFFLAVISDSFEEVNQKELQEERKKKELIDRISKQISFLKDGKAKEIAKNLSDTSKKEVFGSAKKKVTYENYDQSKVGIGIDSDDMDLEKRHSEKRSLNVEQGKDSGKMGLE